MAEVYAGFCEYTDHQVGRIVDYLEESGQLDNTLILYAADNGASGEGSPNGSVNENKFFNAWPDTIEDNLPFLDQLGGPDCYNHYPTGWAVAFSTPYRMFKRYSYQGGVADPLVIHWPAGIKARGEVRSQYHHCTDIVPTILDCCGVEMPAVVDGYEQTPLPGVSMRYSFDEGDAPTRKETQYYEMLGTRGIWHKGWKAVDRARAGPDRPGQVRRGPLAALPHRRGPLGGARRRRTASRQARGAQGALAGGSQEVRRPAADRPVDLRVPASSSTPSPCRRAGSTPTTPARSEVPEASAANTINVSHRILAEVDFTPDAQGVIVAQGSRFGGFSLFVIDGKLTYVYNFLGIPPEQRIAADAPSSGRHIVGIEFTKEGMGEHHEAHGPVRLYVDDEVVAETQIRGIASRFSLCGEGLCVGYDGGDAVSAEYTSRFPFDRWGDHQGRDRRRRRCLPRPRVPHGRGDGARLRPPPPPAMHARSAGGMWRLSGGGGWGAPSPKGGARGPRRTARCAARSRASARASGCCSSAGR